MTLTDSTTDGPVPFAHHVSRVLAGWDDLERGWQAVVLGLAITVCVKVGLAIPW